MKQESYHVMDIHGPKWIIYRSTQSFVGPVGVCRNKDTSNTNLRFPSLGPQKKASHKECYTSCLPSLRGKLFTRCHISFKSCEIFASNASAPASQNTSSISMRFPKYFFGKTLFLCSSISRMSSPSRRKVRPSHQSPITVSTSFNLSDSTVKSASKTLMLIVYHVGLSAIACKVLSAQCMYMSVSPPTVIRAHCSKRHQPRDWYVSSLHTFMESWCVHSGATMTKKREMEEYTASESIDSVFR
mmetsp:Transcript_48554/g.128714  ORF Transcript_48554/g.128714 Transcript_48554/m.128714 type:complete len:243 (-) Transcript_48554:2172-2900(-)